MQFATLLATSLLALASAAPTDIPSVTLSITNDVNGANSPVTVPADNVPRNLVNLLGAGSAIAKGGFVATSAQLNQFQDATKCALVSQIIVCETHWEANREIG